MKRAIIRFDAQGTGHCLYTDLIPLQTIGRLSVQRAATVEFEESSQQWEVRDRNGKVIFQSPSRQSCLEWEQEYFSR